jgi:predicted transcriptional regulator
MNIKERFKTFDTYLESIKELKTLTSPLKTIARCVFEAETGVAAPTEAPDTSNSAQDVQDFNYTVEQLGNLLNGQFPKTSYEEFSNEFNEYVADADELLVRLKSSPDFGDIDLSDSLEALRQLSTPSTTSAALDSSIATQEQSLSELADSLDSMRANFHSRQDALANSKARVNDPELNELSTNIKDALKEVNTVRRNVSVLKEVKNNLPALAKTLQKVVTNVEQAKGIGEAPVAEEPTAAEPVVAAEPEVEPTGPIEFETEHEPTDMNDVADRLNLNDYCTKINQSLKFRHILPRGAARRANEILTDIDLMQKSPDVASLKIDTAKALAASLPDFTRHIDELQRKLDEIQREFKPLIGRNNDMGALKKARALREEYKATTDNLNELRNSAKPITGVKDALSTLERAINQANYQNKSANVLNQQYAAETARRDMENFSKDRGGVKSNIINEFMGQTYDGNITIGDAIKQAARMKSFGNAEKAKKIEDDVKGRLNTYMGEKMSSLEAQRSETTNEMMKANLDSQLAVLRKAKLDILGSITSAASASINTDGQDASALSSIAKLSDEASGLNATINATIETIKANAADIAKVMNALKTQHVRHAKGEDTRLEDYFNGESLDPAKFTKNAAGELQYILHVDKAQVNVPIQVAYELANGFYTFGAEGDSYVLAENLKGKSRWKVVYVPNDEFSRVEMVTSFNDTNNVSVIDLYEGSINDVIVKTFDDLGKTVPGVKPIEPAKPAVKVRKR